MGSTSLDGIGLDIVVGVIGEGPFALLVLALLARAGYDPILVALHSLVAEQLRWMGVRLTGCFKGFVERMAFTVCSENLDQLPDRAFHFLLVCDEDRFERFVHSLPAFPALINRRTKIIALQDRVNSDAVSKQFPDQVFRAWAIADLELPEPQIEPNWVRIRSTAPSMYIEFKSDEDVLMLHSFAQTLTRAGLASFAVHKVEDMRSRMCIKIGGFPVSLSTTFVEFRKDGNNRTGPRL